MQRPGRGAAHWLAPCGLLSLLSYRTKEHQASDGTSQKGTAPPPPPNQTVIKKMLYLTAGSYRGISSLEVPPFR
jgi:hypothetical protein